MSPVLRNVPLFQNRKRHFPLSLDVRRCFVAVALVILLIVATASIFRRLRVGRAAQRHLHHFVSGAMALAQGRRIRFSIMGRPFRPGPVRAEIVRRFLPDWKRKKGGSAFRSGGSPLFVLDGTIGG